MKRSQITHFTSVKFFALKFGCVKVLTNIMSGCINWLSILFVIIDCQDSLTRCVVNIVCHYWLSRFVVKIGFQDFTAGMFSHWAGRPSLVFKIGCHNWF